MRIDIISAVPKLLDGPFSHSILKRAQDKGLIEIHVHDLRKYSTNKQKSIDDYTYGGGAGMVLQIQPVDDCITELKAQRDYDEVIFMAPDGETLNQNMANELSLLKRLIILCGHYKGVDERVRTSLITREISIGDYVLSGGELGAAVLVDAIGGILPGAINDETSALTDSFQDNLLSPPVYTRPKDYKGMVVPDILTSGNTPKIEEWRYEQALKRTQERRPDLLE